MCVWGHLGGPTPESPIGMGGCETDWEPPPPPPPELQWIPSLEVVTLAVDGNWQVAGFEADMAESEVAPSHRATCSGVGVGRRPSDSNTPRLRPYSACHSMGQTGSRTRGKTRMIACL